MTPKGLVELVEGKPLTENELEILLGAANGETSRDTADRLCYAPETIREMRKYALAKLGAKNLTNAVAIGLSIGVINPDMVEVHE